MYTNVVVRFSQIDMYNTVLIACTTPQSSHLGTGSPKELRYREYERHPSTWITNKQNLYKRLQLHLELIHTDSQEQAPKEPIMPLLRYQEERKPSQSIHPCFSASHCHCELGSGSPQMETCDQDLSHPVLSIASLF